MAKRLEQGGHKNNGDCGTTMQTSIVLHHEHQQHEQHHLGSPHLTLQLLPTALQLVQPFPGSFRLGPEISQLLPAGLPFPANRPCISLTVQPRLQLLLQLLV